MNNDMYVFKLLVCHLSLPDAQPLRNQRHHDYHYPGIVWFIAGRTGDQD